jgi:hypothetical protein
MTSLLFHWSHRLGSLTSNIQILLCLLCGSLVGSSLVGGGLGSSGLFFLKRCFDFSEPSITMPSPCHHHTNTTSQVNTSSVSVTQQQ